MDFFKAKEIYRTRAGDQFRTPDLARSTQHGNTWRLRDYTGRSLAIVDKDGRVLCSGVLLTK